MPIEKGVVLHHRALCRRFEHVRDLHRAYPQPGTVYMARLGLRTK